MYRERERERERFERWKRLRIGKGQIKLVGGLGMIRYGMWSMKLSICLIILV